MLRRFMLRAARQQAQRIRQPLPQACADGGFTALPDHAGADNGNADGGQRDGEHQAVSEHVV
jgi:hypothetical protein